MARWYEIVDSGIPFDVLSVPPPDLDAPVMERPTGGLGIHLIKRLTDSAAYRREGGRNILELRVRLNPKNDVSTQPEDIPAGEKQ